MRTIYTTNNEEMKVVLKRGSVPGQKTNFIPPSIPFERPVKKSNKDDTTTLGEQVAFDLRAQPIDTPLFPRGE